MTVVSTESDFRAHLQDHLDRANEDDETVYIARANNRGVAVISQEKLFCLERAVRAKEGSLESAAARDQLIRRHVLPDDEVVEQMMIIGVNLVNEELRLSDSFSLIKIDLLRFIKINGDDHYQQGR